MIPQIIMAVLVVASLLLGMWQHGDRRDGNYDFRIVFVAILINQILLFWGGFYAPFFN